MSEVRAQGHQLVTRARRGPAGTSAIWLDLNNENDSILYDGDGNKLSDNVVSTAKLYDGGVDVTSLVANWSLSLNGCSGSNAANVITITALSAAAATATLSCTYKSQTFSIVLSIKKIVGTVKYDLVVSPDAISYNTTTQVKSSDTINVKIYRTAQKTGGIMTREFVTAIPANVQLKVDGTAVASSSYNSTTGYTFNVDVSKTSHVVSLLQDSVLTDEETIPIGNVVNGEDGEDAIRLDLNNENDSLLYDAEGNLLSGNVTSVATLYSGEAPVASGVTYAIKERSGCTAQQATISGNTVNVSGINSSGYVIVSATYKNKEYTAKFSLKRLVGTVKYDLVVSPDAVSYNTTTGDKSSATVNVKIYRTAQNNSDGVTRQAVSSIPSGYTLKVDNVAVSSASYGANGYTFNVDVSRDSHIVTLLEGSIVADEETVPINKSTNGTNGGPGDPGSPGEDAIILDLDNENDSILYDAEGTKLSANVTSTAKLYKGGVEVSSGVTFAISERSGCTSSQATISNGVVTVTGISGDAYVVVRATYNSKYYYAKLTIKKLIGTVKYDLVVTPDAVAYNTTTGDKSSSTINVKIYRTAQNNSGGVTRQLVADIPSGYTLQVDGTNVNAASYDSGYTFNVNVSRSSHVVSLLKGSVIEDSETVPINKSTNGTNGNPGSPGEPGSDGDGIIEVYMWSPTKPSAPTGTSKTPSGWSDSPNREALSFTYRNEGDTGASSFLTEGIYRRNPKILDNETIAERIKFTTTKANQNIFVDIHADSESASYDYLAVGRLDNTSWTSSPLGKVGGTNGSALVQVAVATPGEHFIIIGYRKDSSVSKGKDYGWYRFLPDENLNCWFSRGVIDGATGTVKSWSDPLRYYADSVDEESVYLLANSTATPDTPTSDAYTDDFIPPRSTINYNGTQSCSLNSIVMYNGRAYKTIVAYSVPSAYDSSKQYIINERFTYQGEAYRCKQSCPSSGINPSNTTYFEVLTPANNTTNFTEVPTWTDDPSDVSATYRYQFISERKKTNGAWGAFSTPRLYNTAGIAGIDYRIVTWETNTEYRNDSNNISVDPRVIHIATNMPMALISDPNFHAYQCVQTHTSSANIPLGTVGYWAEINNLQPLITPLVLAQKIAAGCIDVDSLNVKLLSIYTALGALLGKIGDMNDYTVDGVSAKYPFWIGGATPVAAVTRIDSTGKLTAKSGQFGQLHIDSDGIAIESDDSEDDYQYGHLSCTTLKFFDDDLEYRVLFDVFGVRIYESNELIASFSRYGAASELGRIGSSSSNSFNLGFSQDVVLYACSGNTAYLNLPASPAPLQRYKIINTAKTQNAILRCSSSVNIVTSENGISQSTVGSYHQMSFGNNPSVIYVYWDGTEWIAHL